MSDSVKHECAVTMLRLRRDLGYYIRKYGSAAYGYHKLALMLEKQHNRGQDGAGIGCVRLHPEPGTSCWQTEKSNRLHPLADLFERIAAMTPPIPERNLSGEAAKKLFPFVAELYLGHLRYGTFGKSGIEACHPFVRENSCLNRTLLMAGNFNLTNTEEVLQKLLAAGHHPACRHDGALILQLIGHHLEKLRDDRERPFDLGRVLTRAAADLDGAYTFAGILGSGEAFALRDNAGIRPGFYYFDDEVVAVASERPAIQAAFNCSSAEVSELPPGEALLVSPAGEIRFAHCAPKRELRRCVFERIYFSRGNDAEIHQERKALGRFLTPAILRETGRDWENTFFSYIPNTAQISFHGLLEALQAECVNQARQSGKAPQLRFGQIAVKDAKFRTFIADAATRADLYMHVYDVTYGLLHPGVDTLVVLDDSIVRGNTVRNAILPILDRLGPKKIIIASAAPPIRYPDCYGIDMARFHELAAFEALIDLIREHNHLKFLAKCTENARRQLQLPPEEMTNCIQPLYELFTQKQLTQAIVRRLTPPGLRAEFNIIYQTCDHLVRCCPNHRGDWYFTGNYPTPGGFKVVNQALVNYVEKNPNRPY